MPYSSITRTSDGAGAICYARGKKGKGHNNKIRRNEYITGLNMLPDEVVPFEVQMQPYWDRADVRNKTQINRFIVSFGLKELDPTNPTDVMKGHAIMCEIMAEICPEHQVGIFTQVDGVGGLIHVHAVANNVNMITGKGMNSLSYAHFNFRKTVDRICEQYFDLQPAPKLPDKTSSAVRGARAYNEEISARTEPETEPPKLKYIWIDDLKERVKAAVNGAADYDGFITSLAEHGVELHTVTKDEKTYYLYELIDISKFDGEPSRNLKVRSRKLGTDFEPDIIAQRLKTTTCAAIKTTPSADISTPNFKRKPTEKEKNKSEVEKAKESAVCACTMPIFLQLRGMNPNPVIIEEAGGEWPDYAQMNDNLKAAKNDFNKFSNWRVGRGLPPIYEKSEGGSVYVIWDELERQYLDYSDRELHPEKYMPKPPPPIPKPSQPRPSAPPIPTPPPAPSAPTPAQTPPLKEKEIQTPRPAAVPVPQPTPKPVSKVGQIEKRNYEIIEIFNDEVETAKPKNDWQLGG